MLLEVRDIIQIAVLLLTAGAMYATQKNESKHQSAQHVELKDATTEQANEIGRRIDTLRTTIENVAGDSREHGARIDGIEGRVKRAEDQLDQLVAGKHA